MEAEIQLKLCDLIVVGAGPAGVAAAIKSAEAGYSTIIVEKSEGRRKPCGGVLTTACIDVLSRELNLSLPENVLSSPSSLSLFYVSPSGYGGRVRNYSLVNVERRAFDEWLRSEAYERGAKLLYGASLVDIEQRGREVIVNVKHRGRVEKLAAKFLVGSDGALSKVRRALYPETSFKLASVVQEHWDGNGEIEDCFYMLLLGSDVTPLYGYLIPKGSTLIIGAGAPTLREARASLARVKDALKEMDFKPYRLVRKEHWFIPQGTVLYGDGNIVLAGDAGGFCNPFSGEGIRFALETGAAAAQALKNEDGFSESYKGEVEEIASLIKVLSQFMVRLDDEARDEFVKRELRRFF